MSRGRRHAALVMVAAIGLMATACSLERALPAPDCITADSGIIVAQSVPGAELVPCTNGVPAGWNVDSVSITEDGTDIRFDSDRAGEDAARLRFQATCDLGDAVPIPGDIGDAKAYEYVERLEPGFRASRYYTFPGGCAWWDFDFDNGVSASLSVELGNTLEFVTRDAINENIRASFIDEEV